ncbi:recombinase family protein [Rubellimicrobium rubrum]|uniref:recombinase family protein n=1 Tax=Rubellimicrobium rubrum TaxID=2585369 RepID=UPI003CCC59EB
MGYTTTPHGRLMLMVLAGLAEFERELIRVRTSEGRERAKREGRKMGRPYRLMSHHPTRPSAASPPAPRRSPR